MILVIKLEVWDGKADSYDRLGLNEEYMDILGNNGAAEYDSCAAQGQKRGNDLRIGRQ